MLRQSLLSRLEIECVQPLEPGEFLALQVCPAFSMSIREVPGLSWRYRLQVLNRVGKVDIAMQCSSTLTDSVVLLFLVAVQYAHPCIDPGSGSYILQLIIAGLLGLARPLRSIVKGSSHRFLISFQEVRRMRMRAPSGAVPSSFRDPSGFLFFKDGSLYRQVTVIYNDNYDRLMNSGL